jgi:hypothetical protein
MYTINTILNSSPMFCSELQVPAQHRVNVSIRIGASFVSAPTQSTFSGTVTLQRQFQDSSDPAEGIFRDVAEWAIVTADATEGGVEVITAIPEPEQAIYRAGIKSGDYDAGACFVRLGVAT